MGAVRAAEPDGSRDAGAAVAEAVMVLALLTVLFAGLLELGLVLHVRNTLVDCAGEGARFGGLADRTPADGAERTRALVAQDLPGATAVQVAAGYASAGDLPVVEVTATAPVPVLGWVTGGTITVTGHGLVEVLP